MSKSYHIVTYGCQMNVHESEKLAGILRANGYTEESKAPEEADIVVFNTCCIRENAENHAMGNIGALKKIKRARPDMLVAVGGCMTQQEGAAQRLRKKFPFVDIVFGTHNLDDFGTLLTRKAAQKKADSAFERLIAAGKHLLDIIYQNEGLSNKDKAKFESQINNLADKWEL